MPVMANIGVPMVFLHWPLMVCASAPVIVMEVWLHWMIPAAVGLLLIPCFYLSVILERRSCAQTWSEQDPARVRRAVFSANLVSYTLLFVAASGWATFELAAKGVEVNGERVQERTPSGLTATPASGSSAEFSKAVSWLEQEAHRIIRASKRSMADGTAAFPPQVGIGYEAFWLRDYAYTLEGSVNAYTDKELTDACRLFVRSIRHDGAGVDCVKFDGTPIYMPGFGSMGKNPVADGSQFTVAVAWHTYQKTKDTALLREIVDALVKTMKVTPRNPENGLVHIKPGEEWDRCPYGFCDTVRQQGDTLFCSLLYVQAGRQLADLLEVLNKRDEAGPWRAESERVSKSVRQVFWDADTGLFRAATVRCREHDIWGSAFAVYLGVADRPQSLAVANYFKSHYSELVRHGQVRHLPGGVYWEQAGPRDTYQNGAFWATPTGWFVYTLNLVDPQLADQTVIDMVNDFRQGGACEWIFGAEHHLPHYLASASLPLAGIRAMVAQRRSP